MIIHMDDDTQIRVEGKGSIKLKHGVFKDVLYVPSLATNLLFVYQMKHTSSIKQVVFGTDSMEISDISTWNLIVKGVANHAPRHMNSHTFFHTQIQYSLSCHLKGEVKPLYLHLLHMIIFPLVFQI